MILVVAGDAFRNCIINIDLRWLGTSRSDSPFDFTDTGQILIEFSIVISSEFRLQTLGVIGNKIEHAFLKRLALLLALVHFARFAASEQSLEHQSRVHLFADGRDGFRASALRTRSGLGSGSACLGIPAAQGRPTARTAVEEEGGVSVERLRYERDGVVATFLCVAGRLAEMTIAGAEFAGVE